MKQQSLFKPLQISSGLRIFPVDSKRINYDGLKNDLRDQVELLEDKYPGIDIWFKRKVVPGIKRKDRLAYLINLNEKPVGAMVLKKGKDTKLCSMRISNDYRGKGIGKILMGLFAMQIRPFARDVHFTAPETVYESHKNFFDEYGFSFIDFTKQNYRSGEQEVYCRASYKDLYAGMIRSLPSLWENIEISAGKENIKLVLSIKPKYVDKIKKREKEVEIRRKFGKKWKYCNVLLYASKPAQEFFGEAFINDIVEDSPELIWNNFNSKIGATKSEFFEYCSGLKTVNALILSDLNIYKHPMFKMSLEEMLNQKIHVPQSHLVVRKETAWPMILLLNNLFSVKDSFL